MRAFPFPARPAAFVAAAVLGLSLTAPAYALTVNTQADNAPTGPECQGVAGDCGVRQAVDKANAAAGATTINVPAGTYQLTRAPSGTDDDSTGDLHVTNTSGVTIVGANPSNTILEAGTSTSNGIDRVLSVESGASASLSNLTIQFGKAPGAESGGGILDNGSLTLTNDVVTMNQTTGAGGGVDMSSMVSNTNVHLVLINTSVSTNKASGIGGGIADEGDGDTVTVSQSTIHGNTATQEGGGIENNAASAVNVTQSTIDGNTAQFGGAIAEEGGDPMSGTAPAVSLTNDTINNNHAVGPKGGRAVGGGGLDGDGGGTFVLVNTTLTNNGTANTTSLGGNISSDGTDIFDLTNSIIAGGSPQNCYEFSGRGSLAQVFFSSGTHQRGTANGNNLSDDSTCQLSSTNRDRFPANPMLGPLQSNGGPTFTQALMAGSPAIDTANDSACPSTDQRGITRPQGPHCDIGAFEFVPPAPGGGAGGATQTGPTPTPPAPQGCPTVSSAKIQLHHVRKLHIVRARIFVNGKLNRSLKGRALLKPFRITSLPRALVVVRIRGVPASGRHHNGVRKFNTCPRTKRRHPPPPRRL